MNLKGAAVCIRTHLMQGGRSYGPLIMSDSSIISEVLAHTGYGHVVIDHEHSPTDVRSGQSLLRAFESSPTVPIVRLPGHDALYMKKVLDSMSLPGGVLVPMVEDASTAEAVVRSARYPPAGVRGCASPFIRGSSYGQDQEYLRKCDENLLVMVQVETEKGVEAIPEICCVEGIDAVFLGPMDLSASMGKMGQFDDPEFKAILQKAQMYVKQSKECMLAGFRVPGMEIKDMFNAGYSLVCGTVDLRMLQSAAEIDAQAGKEAIDLC